jgi:hypothetical protein
MTFDATLKSATATSYISVATAQQLLATLPQSPGITEWLALTAPQHEQTLVGATLVLDPMNWKGHKCDCNQRLQWPRQIDQCRCGATKCDSLPFNIELATAYLAATMGSAGSGYVNVKSMATGGAASSGGSGLDQFESVTLGPISVTMKKDYVATSTTALANLPTFVRDLIGEYLAGQGISQGMVGRGSIAMARQGLPVAPAYSGRFYLNNGVVTPRWGGWGALR